MHQHILRPLILAGLWGLAVHGYAACSSSGGSASSGGGCGGGSVGGSASCGGVATSPVGVATRVEITVGGTVRSDRLVIGEKTLSLPAMSSGEVAYTWTRVKEGVFTLTASTEDPRLGQVRLQATVRGYEVTGTITATASDGAVRTFPVAPQGTAARQRKG